jgi:hypothetical protein
MPKKKTAKHYFQQVREKGAGMGTGIANGDEIQEKLQPGTVRNYSMTVAM